MPRLRIRNGPKAGTEFSFDKSVVIGRGPMADLSLDDPTISRRHAMLTWAEDQCFLSDLESENGTYVNNARISEPTRLRSGDLVNVGTVIGEYTQDAAGADTSRHDSSVRLLENSTTSPKVVLTMSSDHLASEALSGGRGGEALAIMARRIRFLSDLGKVVSQTFDEGALLSFVLDQVFELLPQADRAFVLLWDNESNRLIPTAARTRSGRSTEIAASRTLLEDAIRKREGILFADALDDARYASADSIYASHIFSAICVPMISHDEIFGVIQVDSTRPAMLFGKGDMALMLGVAAQVAMSLANAKLHARLVERELIERDMMLARKIQQHFLPQKPPKPRGYTFAVDYSPALAVGGDLYDFIDLDRERIGIAVGDVSGKGVSAALYVAKLSSDVRYLSVGQAEPAEILKRVNRALCRSSKEGMFVTLALVSLDTRTGELQVASAGHPLPLLRNAHGEVVPLGVAGDLPVGLNEDASFGQHRHQLAPSDVVVLYTDGVSEAENQQKELFGNARLIEAVRRSAGTVDGIMHSVLSAVETFAGTQPQSDDLTLLCFGRKSP